MEILTLTWTDADQLLRDLRAWGGNVALGRFKGCRTPRWLAALKKALHTHLVNADGCLSLEVEVVYGHAIKPRATVQAQRETQVSLDAMRQMVRRKKS